MVTDEEGPDLAEALATAMPAFWSTSGAFTRAEWVPGRRAAQPVQRRSRSFVSLG
jgi:hypothetical protein